MTAPDRSEELIRAMLERRAGGEAPTWLAERTVRAAGGARQVRLGWRDRLLPGDGSVGRVALIAAAVVALLVLTGGALVAGGWIDLPGPAPALPAVVVEPDASGPTTSPSGDPSADPATSGRPSLAPVPTPRPVPTGLAEDTIAIVTRDGDGLRIRSAPGVGPDSEKLEPLLPAGARLLVQRGPVAADGYDWFEVLADVETGWRVGWVAAGGKDGAPWIKPRAPACAEESAGLPYEPLDGIDGVACYGNATREIYAWGIEGAPGWPDDSCPWTGGDRPCGFEPGWMNGLYTAMTDWGPVNVAVPPDLEDTLDAVGPDDAAILTVRLDDPSAASCRLVDLDGNEVTAREVAAALCRLILVVRDVNIFEGGAPDNVDTGDVPELVADTLVTVETDSLPLWNAPNDESGDLPGQLQQGAVLYLDAGPVDIDGEEWWGVLPRNRSNGGYGWITASDFGLDLVPTELECPDPADWAAWGDMPAVDRLVCTDGEPVTIPAVIRSVPEPQPTSAFACMASQPRIPCQATPAWLSSPTGVDVTGPGSMPYPAFPAVDPSVMSQADLPRDPTLMLVTGRYEDPRSADCRVTDPMTGGDLVDPAEAAIYCRARFVISAAEPAP